MLKVLSLKILSTKEKTYCIGTYNLDIFLDWCALSILLFISLAASFGLSALIIAPITATPCAPALIAKPAFSDVMPPL